MTSLLRRSPFLLLVLATLGFVFAGCTGAPKDLSGLTAKVEGIRSLSTRNGQSELIVTLRVHNETVRPIGIQGFELHLSINGIDLGRVRGDKPLATQALSSNTQDLTWVIADRTVAERIAAAMRRGTVTYELVSRVMVMSGDNEMRSKSSSGGSIDTRESRISLD